MDRPATRIIVIRHAEKPNGSSVGVTFSGSHDPRSLTVRGWQRAGALAHFFGRNLQDAPQCLFASHSSSNRPHETLIPLSEKLGLTINLDFGKGDEDALASAAAGCAGTVLICWQHEFMNAVANAILGNTNTAPKEWPAVRFDVFWHFDLDSNRQYQFSQAPQLLLAGDSDSVIEP
jgi:hypothetical protein